MPALHNGEELKKKKKKIHLGVGMPSQKKCIVVHTNNTYLIGQFIELDKLTQGYDKCMYM